MSTENHAIASRLMKAVAEAGAETIVEFALKAAAVLIAINTFITVVLIVAAFALYSW